MASVLSSRVTLAAAFSLCAATSASAYTFQVIHNFTGGKDGGAPSYTLLSGKKGFVGTAFGGGATGNGIVFNLKDKSSGWTVRPVYNFADTDGAPGWGVTRFNGSLYTNALYAGVMGGSCGSALQLNPATHGYQSVLMHTYVKDQDGCPTGNLVLDSSGNVYGVTQDGGANGWGSIFELSNSGGTWTETILYSFHGASDGGAPYSAPIFDKAGNLYGTATAGGSAGCGQGCGTVYELSPGKSGWTYNVLYSFTGGNDGGQPTAGLVFAKAGNLCGAAESFGAKGGGTVFELSPSGSGWSFNLLTGLPGTGGPVVSLTLDGAHTIYGTSFFGTSGYGAVFRLKRSSGTWTYKDLHDFTGGSDGGYPGGGITLDAGGNLYGTAVLGGSNNDGVIYELTK
jgi:uncharacterized repeat protein (TIGR03803 family)